MKRYIKGWMTTLAAGLLQAAAHAATYYVDLNYDGANGTPNGTETRPYTTITAGVAAAEAVSGTHVVLIADGTYRSLLSLGHENFGTEGLVFTRNLTIRGGYVGQANAGVFDWTEGGRTPRSTIIDLADAGTRAFSTTGHATFDGLTIRNASHAKEGGAILRTGGHAQGVTIRNCLFTNNVVTANDGGAVSAHGRYAAVLIEDCDFMDNGARRGGAARVRGSPSTDTRVPLTIRRCTFTDNHSTEYGGALEVPEGGPLTVEECVFSGNEAGTHSGALLWASGGHAFTARRSIFAGNSSASGAAAVGATSRPATYENCLFHGNAGPYTVEVTGGGLTVLHCTLSGNPNTVSALRVTQPLTVKNSIIVNNGLRGIQRTGTQSVDVDYNNVWGHSAGDYDGLSAGGNDISADPLFADAAGGDYRLAKGSPCVDAGMNLGIALDLSGIPRPTRAGFDMGCYEEWQIPIIVNRSSVVTAEDGEARAEFVYESDDMETYAYLVLATTDAGTSSIGDWWQSAAAGKQSQGVIFGRTFTGLDPDTVYVYRCVASNSYDMLWGALGTFKTSAAGAGVTRLWTNADGDGLASNPDNWDGGVRPTADDFILLDTYTADLTWDAGVSGLPDTVMRWTQTENYTGTVTIRTRYPGQGAFEVFTISGDCVVANGTWTHANDNNSSSPNWPEYSRLNVKIEGQLTLGASAVIDVDGRGYSPNQGPGGGSSGASGRGASHGGQGGFNTTVVPVAPYGSLFAPIRLGSGALGARGGGAVRLVVDQATLLQGEIRARAGTTTDTGAAGGSVFLTTQTLSGDGLIDVSGGNGSRGDRADGAGGRIAVVLTSGTSFGNVRMRAHGGNFGYRAAAGTVYRQTGTQQTGAGSLIVDNNNGSVWPALTVPAETVNLDALAELVVTNNGHFVVDAKVTVTFGTAHIHGGGDVRVRDTANVSFPSPFNLASGYTLCLDTPVTAFGNWNIASNAVLSHTFSEYQHSVLPDNAINLTIHGDLTVAKGGRISAYGRGYSSASPGGRVGGHTGAAGTHGGRGGYNPSSLSPIPTYGSVRAPVLSGSGGAERGGGAIRLDVRGSLRVDGEIDASGYYKTAGIGGSGSGGSIYIVADAMTGVGQLNAKGGESLKADSVSSGGGRISVVLRNGDGFGSVAMTAVGGKEGTAAYAKGAAGTIYRQAGDELDGAGTVVINNTGVTTTLDVVTVLPPNLLDVEEELVAAALDLQANAKLLATTNLLFRALSIDNSAILNLAGHTVTLKESFAIDGVVYGHGEYAAADLPAQVVDTAGVNGRVILLPPPGGTLILLR